MTGEGSYAPVGPSTSQVQHGKLLEIKGLEFNFAYTMEECIEALEMNSLPAYPDMSQFLLNIYTFFFKNWTVYYIQLKVINSD